ncbi:DUF5808 domain-containing protein [Acidianus manzaensis]|uniref:DUF5808 domain-containing protein n=1 Tax=Acidianus manzaensis TaxID=282676 RepID=A0A1W6JWH2_9CREN|nr:DUF5808 domain-containing protein [Acidianus manzaensis]ARM74607.1 hypothetical protein B6F84_00235 [Acidianus manzaensis]
MISIIIVPIAVVLLAFIMEFFLPDLQAPDILLGARVKTEFKKEKEGKTIVLKYRLTLILAAILSLLLTLINSLFIDIFTPLIFAFLSSMNVVYWRRVVIKERGEELPEPTKRYAIISTPQGKMIYMPLILAWIVLISTIIIGIVYYSSAPAEIPYHVLSSGKIEYVPKTIIKFFLIDLIALIPFSLITIFTLISAKTPNIINPAYPEQSYIAYSKFKESVVILSGVILFIIGTLMTSISFFIWGFLKITYIPELLVSMVSTIFLLTTIFYFKVGVEGGSYLRNIVVNNEVFNDDKYWKGGIIYYNPADPRIMVPRRNGFGYTINLGNRTGLLILISLIAIIPTVVVLIILLAR